MIQDAFEVFQAECARLRNPKETMDYWVHGITGEAGEVADVVKKYRYHGVTDFKGDDFLTALEKELGDTLHGLAGMCNYLDLNLATVARKNIEKLELRYPTGFVPGGGLR